MPGGWVYIMTNSPHGTLYIGVTAEIAARIHAARITGMEPQIAPSLDGAVCHAIITLHKAECLFWPDQDLAHLAHGQFVVVIRVGDNNLKMFVPYLARAARLIRRIVRPYNREIAFGHSEQFVELRHVKALTQRGLSFVRDRHSADHA